MEFFPSQNILRHDSNSDLSPCLSTASLSTLLGVSPSNDHLSPQPTPTTTTSLSFLLSSSLSPPPPLSSSSFSLSSTLSSSLTGLPPLTTTQKKKKRKYTRRSLPSHPLPSLQLGNRTTPFAFQRDQSTFALKVIPPNTLFYLMAPSPFFYPTSPLSSTCHRIHLDSIQDGHSSLTLCLSITPTVLHLKRPRSKLTFHRLLPCTPSLPLDDPSFVSNFPRSFINEWKDLLNTNKNNVDWYFKDPIKLHRPLCDLMHGGSPEAWVQPVSFQQLKLNSSEVASASFTFVSIQKKDLSLLFNSSPTCTKGSEGLS